MTRTVCGWAAAAAFAGTAACASFFTGAAASCVLLGSAHEQTAWPAAARGGLGLWQLFQLRKFPSVLGLQRVFIRNRCGIC